MDGFGCVVLAIQSVCFVIQQVPTPALDTFQNVYLQGDFMKPVSYVVAAVVSTVLLSGPVEAKTFKWSFASDIPTLYIHSQNNALSNGIHAAFY